MAHPLVNPITELATPIAGELELELVNVIFQTNKKPPVLRVDVRKLAGDTGLDDCEKMSRALDSILEEQDIIPGAYVLEVSSPGTTRQLTNDREFIAFKGFPVIIQTYAPFQGEKQWQGRLQSRDESTVHINKKGKAIAIPRNLVAKVQLDDHDNSP